MVKTPMPITIMRWSFFLFLFVSLVITKSYSQKITNGPAFEFGSGFAYSTHADSYTNERPGGQGLFITHNGARLLATKLKAGWIFRESVMLYYTLTYAPPNTTVSPYISTYHGIAIAWFPKSMKEWYMTIGAGRNRARDKYGRLAEGILAETGIGFQPNPHFVIEFNSMFGEMRNEIEPAVYERRLASNSEFFIQLSANYLFYRKPG